MKRKALLAISVIALSLGIISGVASAHGEIDQSFDDTTGSQFQGAERWGWLKFGQSFVPSSGVLDGVDLLLNGNRNQLPFTEHLVKVDIVKIGTLGSFTVIGSSQQLVTPSGTGDNDPGDWVHFDFLPALSLIPGDDYAIRIDDLNGSTDQDSIEWAYVTNGSNGAGNYLPGGYIYFDGAILYDWYDSYYDFLFRTYEGLDPDTDGDGVNDVDDNCDSVANPGQTDTDGDLEGNACDTDDDGDGVADDSDCAPLDKFVHPGAAEVSNGIDDDCDTLLTKGDVLIISGIDTESIRSAPGLLKLFNPKSQATENAGKKK
ncbi:MAG: hypothetical protein HOF01_09865 [Chloroflexi bacterium]|jgi:hypothetical protein|nr:hypothetical protein [Chloroflexota bacterium]